MNNFHKTIVIRHGRENLKKCSLSGLERHKDILFLTYPLKIAYDFSSCFLLTLDLSAPQLTMEDNSLCMLLLDATWKLADKMEANIKGLQEVPKRSLPLHFKTAYPRRQLDCKDPSSGLASIEALFIAYTILGRECSTLLDNYYWKEKFFQLNQIV